MMLWKNFIYLEIKPNDLIKTVYYGLKILTEQSFGII